MLPRFRPILGLLLACALVHPAMAADSLKGSQDKLIVNIRKALSIPVEWPIKLTNVGPSPVAGLNQADLEVQVDTENVRTQRILISQDNQYYVVGNMFDANVDMDLMRAQTLDLSKSPSKGSANAPVTIVEFSDLQCASCKNAHLAIERDRILETYKGKVRLVYKNNPLMRFHPWAYQASIGGMCAYRQKPQAFWETLNDVFAKQSEITTANVRQVLLQSAQRQGLNTMLFQTCLDNQATAEEVNRDMAEAGALGLTSTPSFLVNGRVVVGYPGAESFKRLINEFLK